MKPTEKLHDDTPNEILRAEREVDESRRDLELALVRLDQKLSQTIGTVQERFEDVSTRATDTVTQVRDRIENTIQGIDQAVNEVGTQFTSAVNEVSGAVEGFSSEVTGGINEVSEVVEGFASEVKGSVTELTTQITSTVDQISGKIADSVQEFGTRVTTALDAGSEISTRVDSVITRSRGEITRLLDQAEQIADKLRDPGEYLAQNPRMVAPILLIAGMVVGLFFRDLLRGNRHLTDASSTPGVPDSTLRRVA